MSSNKDKITTDHSREETERVRSEQEYLKQKGKEVASAASNAKENAKEGNISLPSNERLTSALQHGQESLSNLQASDRGQQMNSGGEKVVEDIKRVLADQQTIIGEKNEGDVLQNIVKDFLALLQELRTNSELKGYFEDWQGRITAVFSSGDFTQFFQQTGDLFTSMKETDEFLGLASELVDLMKIVVAEATEKMVEGDTAAKEEFKRQREMERRRVARELRYTLSSMTRNEMWRGLIQRSKVKVGQVKSSANKEQAEQLFYNLRSSPNFQRLLEDFKVLLQRLVGNQMSVDPLFDYAKKALDDIADDDQLSQVVDEMQRLLPSIAEDTSVLDDPTVQRELDSLSRRADEAIMSLRNNRNIQGAKEESIKVANAIKNEASNTPLLADLKTLWRDLTSDKEGEVIDPDVLRSLRQMIVPLLVEHLNNVPLPSVSDEASFLGKYYYTIDQMKISLPELIPENIHLRFEYEMDANPLELEAHNQHTFLYLQASNLQLHLHDCHFTYERRTVPKHSDSGVFDVDTVGEGLTVWLKMEIKSDTAKGQYLDVLKSDVKISKFHIAFRDSKHDKLYEVCTHLFAKKIKNSVIEMMQNKFKTFGSYFNEQIITLIEQAKSTSSTFTKAARDKTEQAREKMDNLKLKAQEKKNSDEAQETKEEAKSTVKKAISIASERVQDRLDEAKVQIEQQKREKELDRAIANPSAAEILNQSPTNQLTSPVLTPSHSAVPPLVTPITSASPIPFDSTQRDPSILNSSADSATSYHASAHHLPSDSAQFSPSFAGPFSGQASFPASSSISSGPLGTDTNPHNEAAWVSAKPADLEETQPEQRAAL
eukprot:Phypoly_transcript_02578.p1 GENE.Phypoly_transcript_02578~~Phypoly_transcript_02578.p1  ORF type:complete len:828 (+),score=217.58 Phypoly_transcript_02578:85-2568(+)